MTLPKAVKIGPFHYRIRRPSKALARENLSGAAWHPLLTIAVDRDLHPVYAAETLLHEVLHACWDQTPLRDFDDDVEESIVAALSPLLFGVLRDNPELVRCLTDG